MQRIPFFFLWEWGLQFIHGWFEHSLLWKKLWLFLLEQNYPDGLQLFQCSLYSHDVTPIAAPFILHENIMISWWHSWWGSNGVENSLMFAIGGAREAEKTEWWRGIWVMKQEEKTENYKYFHPILTWLIIADDLKRFQILMLPICHRSTISSNRLMRLWDASLNWSWNALFNESFSKTTGGTSCSIFKPEVSHGSCQFYL